MLSVGRLKLAAPVLLLALAAACTPVFQPAAVVAVPHDWPTLTDATFGFSLRYPTGWVEKFDQPAGFHALASRDSMVSLLDLGDSDYWLVAEAAAHDSRSGCGEPAAGFASRNATTMGGASATRYVIAGSRGNSVQHIVLIIALRGSTCYTLQLVAGGAIRQDNALSMAQTIQSSFRYTR